MLPISDRYASSYISRVGLKLPAQSLLKLKMQMKIKALLFVLLFGVLPLAAQTQQVQFYARFVWDDGTPIVGALHIYQPNGTNVYGMTLDANGRAQGSISVDPTLQYYGVFNYTNPSGQPAVINGFAPPFCNLVCSQAALVVLPTGEVVTTIAKATGSILSFTLGPLPPVLGTIKHIQQASNSDVTGTGYTSFAAALKSTSTSGNAIILGVTFGDANPTITATDSEGNTYTQAIKTYDSGHRQGCAILYTTNIKGGASNQVTVKFSAAVSYLAIGVHEYSGIAAASGVDVTAGATGIYMNPSSGSAATTAAGDLIFGVGVEDSAGRGDTFTAGSGFTKGVDLGTAAAYADENQVQNTAGSIAATWILSPAGNGWIASLAAFKRR